jgi:hypothetical protein
MPEWKDQMISQMYADRLRSPIDVARDTIQDRYRIPEPTPPSIPLTSHTTATRRNDGSWIEKDPLGNPTGFGYGERNKGLNPYQMTSLDLTPEPLKPQPFTFKSYEPEPFEFKTYEPKPFKFESPEPEPLEFEPYRPEPVKLFTVRPNDKCKHGSSFDDTCYQCYRIR